MNNNQVWWEGEAKWEMVIKCLERSRAGQEVKKRSADLQEKYSFFTQSSRSNKNVPNTIAWSIC